MSLLALLFSVSLSLSGVGDYKHTRPVFTDSIEGIGIGRSGDYKVIRIEDMIFLDEAYAERWKCAMFGSLNRNASDYNIRDLNMGRSADNNTEIINNSVVKFEDTPSIYSFGKNTRYSLLFSNTNNTVCFGCCDIDFSLENAVYATDDEFHVRGTNTWPGILGGRVFRPTGNDAPYYRHDIFYDTNYNYRTSFRLDVIKKLYENLERAKSGVFTSEVRTDGYCVSRTESDGEYPIDTGLITNTFPWTTYGTGGNPMTVIAGEHIHTSFTNSYWSETNITSNTSWDVKSFYKEQLSFARNKSTRYTLSYDAHSGYEYKRVYLGTYEGYYYKKSVNCEQTPDQTTFAKTESRMNRDIVSCATNGTEFSDQSFEAWIVTQGLAKAYEEKWISEYPNDTSNEVSVISSNYFVSVKHAGYGTLDIQNEKITFNITAFDSISDAWNYFNLDEHVSGRLSPIQPKYIEEIYYTDEDSVWDSSTTRIIRSEIDIYDRWLIIKVTPDQFHARELSD